MDFASITAFPLSSGGETSRLVTFLPSPGQEMQGTVLRLTREAIAFEIYAPLPVLRFSEVLSSFRITISDQSVYSGRAVVSGLVNAGPVTVCEATLGDGWIEFDLFGLSKPGGVCAKSFEAFLKRWQKFYKRLPAYKLIIADLESFLSEL